MLLELLHLGAVLRAGQAGSGRRARTALPPARAGDPHRATFLLQVRHLRQELRDLLLLPGRVLRPVRQLLRQVNDLLARLGCGRAGSVTAGHGPRPQPTQLGSARRAVPAHPRALRTKLLHAVNHQLLLLVLVLTGLSGDVGGLGERVGGAECDRQDLLSP